MRVLALIDAEQWNAIGGRSVLVRQLVTGLRELSVCVELGVVSVNRIDWTQGEIGKMPKQVVYRPKARSMRHKLAAAFSLAPFSLPLTVWRRVGPEVRGIADGCDVDLIVVSSYKIQRLAEFCKGVCPVALLAVDSLSAAYSDEVKFSDSSLKSKVKARLLRMLAVRHERNLRRSVDELWYVSPVDTRYIRQVATGVRSRLLHMFVDESLFKCTALTSELLNRVLFVGIVGGESARHLDAMLVALQAVRSRQSRLTVTVAGGYISADFVERWQKCDWIRIVPGFEDKVALYESHGVVINPLYKRCGAITKVMEGLASGRVVIGFGGGFGSLEGTKDRSHYFICRDHQEMAAWLCISDEVHTHGLNVANRGKCWAIKHLRFENYMESLKQCLAR